MAKGEKLRQIHLRNVCRALITTDAISAKQVYKYKRRLCAFSSFHKRAFGCTEFKEALQPFYLKHLGDAHAVSSTGAKRRRLAPRWHSLSSATNGFNPHKLEEVAQQEAKIYGDNAHSVRVRSLGGREGRGTAKERMRGSAFFLRRHSEGGAAAGVRALQLHAGVGCQRGKVGTRGYKSADMVENKNLKHRAAQFGRVWCFH